MANTAVLSTCDVPTSLEREQQPLALTLQQKEIIERTWKLVEEVGLVEAGVLLFTRIFEICPHAIALFPFKDVAKENWSENEAFRTHGLQVTEAVELAVSSLDDLDGLYCILKDLGSVHCKYGIIDEHFGIVGEAFIWTLETGLDKEFTPEVREAWTIFYRIVAEKMKEGLQEAHDIMDEKEA